MNLNKSNIQKLLYHATKLGMNTLIEFVKKN
jgi:hypothetical protein